MSSSLPATMCSVTTTPIAVVISPSSGGKHARAIVVLRMNEDTRQSRSNGSSLLYLVAVQPAEPVECGCLVALCECRVIEDGVDEVIDCAPEDHHSLANVHKFARALANDMHSQHLAGVAMEDQLQPPRGVAANLSARSLPVERHADLVWHILIGQLLLGLADKADLRDRVDTVW